MIIKIEGIECGQYPQLMDEMFRMRAEVFSDRLGWDVNVISGLEIDRFDSEDPLYLLSLEDKSGELRGAVRLLPTIGPNMLRDVFGILMPGGAVESPLIWESSRFAINPRIGMAHNGVDANHVVNRTTIELLCGIVEVCRSAGIDHIISVFDARMARIFRSIDCRYENVGTPTRIGRVMTYVGLFDMSEDMRLRLGKVGGLPETVLSAKLPQATVSDRTGISG